MKIQFSNEGDMKITLDDMNERELFAYVPLDARREGAEFIVEKLYPHGCDDGGFREDWQRYSRDEIGEQFSRQLSYYQSHMVKIANGSVVVQNKGIPDIFAAIDQARFGLEHAFAFSREPKLNEASPEELKAIETLLISWSSEKQAAYRREAFYAWFQMILMEGFVPPDDAIA